MVEWSITTVLKTVVLRGTGGSNPSLSAKKDVRLCLASIFLRLRTGFSRSFSRCALRLIFLLYVFCHVRGG